MTEDVSSKRAQRTDIQGLRAVAVVLVVLFHAQIPPFRGGYVGVDVFFVISGFLISTHLIEGLEKSGRADLAKFYARRARRLLPASFLVIALTVLAAAIWAPRLHLLDTFRGAIASILYVPNMFFAMQETGYLADRTPSLFLHYWSLGVEEQFYLVWPVLLYLLFRFIKSRRLLVASIIFMSVVSLAVCIALTAFFPPWAFFTLPARAWEFGVGALVGFALLHDRRALPPTVAAIAGWTGLAAVIGAGLLFSSETAFPGYMVVIPVIGTALIILGGGTPSAAGPTSLLSIAPMTFLGNISYSLYLVHWPLLQIPLAARGYSSPLPLWITVLIALACVPIAWLLYTYVEQPGRQTAWLVKARPRRTLAATGAATLVIAALVAGVWAWTSPLKFNVDKTAAATQITRYPAGTPFVPSNLTPSLPAAKHDFPDLYGIGCQNGPFTVDPSGCLLGSNPGAPLVALFGDSHAVQWLPALAELADQGRIRLLSNTKAGCPAAVWQFEFPFYPTCAEWRQAVIDRLNSDPPDMILVGNANYGPRVGIQGRDPREGSAPTDSVDEKWREAVLTTLQKLPKKSRLALLANTPALTIAPAVCLSKFLDDAGRCALSREQSLLLPARAAEIGAVKEVGGTYFDYTDDLCNQTTCPVIIGNTLVYADDSHITATFSRAMAGQVMTDIEKLLAEPARG